MLNQPTDRREFLKMIGLSSAVTSIGILTPKIIAKTANGFLVESEEEYGGFTVEKFSDKKFPYQFKKDVLKGMSNKMTVFSRNYWDPVRKNRPEVSEDITYNNLVKGEGKIPNQTRLDYALMAASWCVANGPGYPSYKWTAQTGRVRNMEKMGQWNPQDLDMTWEEVSLSVKHASLFFGASLAGIAKFAGDRYREKLITIEHPRGDRERFLTHR